MHEFLYRYILFGGVFAKNTSQDEKFPQAEWRGKFSLETGIFRKYPYQTWYICLITPNII